MINNTFKNYMQSEFNKNVNYKKIIIKERKVVKMKDFRKKIINIAACIAIIVIIGTVSPKIYAKIQWDIKFKEYQNRNYIEETGEIKESSEPRL